MKINYLRIINFIILGCCVMQSLQLFVLNLLIDGVEEFIQADIFRSNPIKKAIEKYNNVFKSQSTCFVIIIFLFIDIAYDEYERSTM